MTLCRCRHVCLLIALTLSLAASVTACLDRETVSLDPTVKTNYQATKEASLAQVDLLFMIDNSTSMGDKQVLLSRAVPNLVNRLVRPNCVGDDGVTPNGTQVDVSTLTCAQGMPEFPAVRDMHIGIVSSSLGDFGVSNGGDDNPGNWACPAHDYSIPVPGSAPIQRAGLESQDDHARLLNRSNGYTPDSPATGDTDSTDYLAWYPAVAGNSATPPAHALTVSGPVDAGGTLSADFASLVKGVQQFGCGYEGQLESWYQFLVQPDPWAAITVANGVAQRVGINTTVLQQRAAFLRPGSIVAVIAVSDEDDSTVDPGAAGGASWHFEDQQSLALPTSACATDPLSPDCTSCKTVAEQGQLEAHPECQPPPDGGAYATYANTPQSSGDIDSPNVRFALMKQRFGVDPQYPISRYLNGLTGKTVPDRNGEATRDPSGSYAPLLNCTNPLYAAAPPDLSRLSMNAETDDPVSPADLAVLCGLPAGGRDPSLVFFGFIGGMPWQLLTHDPASATADAGVSFIAQSGTDDIPETTWTQLIGAHPESYDYSGQSPYMRVSLTPRPELSPPTAVATADPFNGREWNTGGTDLQYACTFDLPTPLDCSAAAIARDAPRTLPDDGLLSEICDCAGTSTDDAARPPLCTNPAAPNQQTRGKAYPGIRELTLVHAMDQQQAKNGIAASLCPRTIATDESDPNFGYNPAVDAIVAKLKAALGSTCLPRALTVTDDRAPCTVLELLPAEGPEDDSDQGCPSSRGLSVPLPDVLARYRSQQMQAGNGEATAALLKRPVCQLTQLDPRCYASEKPGWCYETAGEDPTLGSCPHAVKLTASGALPGAVLSVECSESETAASDGGGADR